MNFSTSFWNKRRQVHVWIYYVLFLALAFLIPVHNRLASWVIAFIFLNWFLELRFVTHFRSIFGNPERWKLFSFAGLYLLYLAGMLWSENKDYGLFDLQVKLSLALFPVFFGTMDDGVTEPWRVKHYFLSFVSGCFAACIWCIVSAFVRFQDTGDTAEFFYGKFSVLMHTSYFSMFINFSIFLILYYSYKNLQNSNRYVKSFIFLVLLFFNLIVILLSSKTGMLTLLLAYIIIAAWFIKQRQFTQSSVPLFFMVSMICMLLLSPQTYTRLKESGTSLESMDTVSNKAKDATSARILIWKASLELLTDDPWIGAGTGDVKDQLLQKYKETGISNALEHRLNAHNQYLQTWMTLGIAGLLFLFLMFLLPGFSAWKSNDFLYLSLLLLVTVNMLTESMFETQSGVVFYAFFNALLFRIRESRTS